MHLRLDRPDRGRRLARWVDGLGADDPLFLAGDTCDFWYATRQSHRGIDACEGLSALKRYTERGGPLTLMTGNHDHWLGEFYEKELGARLVTEPYQSEVCGLRLHVTHGHRAGGRQVWKAGMESRAFFDAFVATPTAVADNLDRLLTRSNDRGRQRDEERLVRIFQQYLDRARPDADVAIFGHVHSPLDFQASRHRVVILGGWHAGASYLRVDESGARLVIERAETVATV